MDDVIDVSLLPAPTLLDTAYEPIRAARLASLKARFEAVGIPWDVGALETDPGVILQEEDAYRQMLDLASINDTVKRVLAAFATGADLDQLVALNGTVRKVVTPAVPEQGVAQVMESDGNLLLRFLAGYSKPAAGSRWGYIARAREAYPGARGVQVYRDFVGGGPRINIILLAPGGVDVPLETIRAVYSFVTADDAVPLTANVSVRGAVLVDWSVSGTISIPKGPDPAIVLAMARAGLAALGDQRFVIGGEIPDNAPAGALYAPNVRKVTLDVPFAGIAAAPDAAPRLDLASCVILPVPAT